MADIFADNIYLILFLPFWIFLIIMIGRFFSVYVNKHIIYGLTLLSSFLGLCLSGALYLNLSQDSAIENSHIFLQIKDFIISYGIYADKTSIIFAIVLFLVSFLVQIFSISYMKNERKNYRFFALLNLFNFSMAGLIFSPNLFQAYAFWEIVGIVSYLLIGFDYSNPVKSIASKKVFITNRIGDTAFIAGILLSSYFVYTYSPNKSLATLSFADNNIISTIISAYTSEPLYLIICVLFIIAAFVKSAQFPFYTWLQDAMEAKLPVSALLHSSTMVAMGIFLTLRLLPFYTLEPITLKIICGIGLLTALLCSISACTQKNPKSVLAYSTSAQLGLVFLAIGILNLKLAFAFFIVHAIIKSALFLSLPKDEKFDLYNFILFLINGLSLSGLILSGMVVKETLFVNLSNKIGILFCIISFLTAFYIIKIALEIGYKNNRVLKKTELSNPVILFLINAILYFYLRKQFQYNIAEPFWSAMLAWVCVYILYIKNAFRKIPLIYELSFNGFYLDKLYSKKIPSIYDRFTNGLNFIETKIFSDEKVLPKIAKFFVKFIYFIENNIMNGSVNFITRFSKYISIFYKKAQKGDIRKYNAYAFFIVTITITCLVIAYISVIENFGGLN